DNQVIFGRKIPVQRHLRRAGSGDDGIDSHRPDTFAAEQILGGPAYPLASAVLPLVRWAARQFPPVSHCHASSSLPGESMNSIPSASGMVVRQAQELWVRIHDSALNPGDYCL